MRVVVPKEFLIQGKACQEGMDTFDVFADDDRGIVDPWTPLHTLRLYQLHPDSAAWLRVRRLIPPPNFDGMDLTGIRLVKADLRYVSFVNATLSNADLSGSDLRRAVLLGARLDGIVLDEHTNLDGAYYDGIPPVGWVVYTSILRRTLV